METSNSSVGSVANLKMNGLFSYRENLKALEEQLKVRC